MSTTQTKSSMFGAAKKVEKKSSSKKQKEIIIVDGIDDDVERFLELKAQEDELKNVGSSLKQVGFKEWARIYDETGTKPESFKLAGKEGGKALGFVVIDRYLALPSDDDGRRVEELRTKYGNDVVATSKVFQFNQVLLDKHFEKITAAIENAIAGITGIEEKEHEKLMAELIEVKEVNTIAPRSLEKHMPTAAKRREFIQDIQPIVQLKQK